MPVTRIVELARALAARRSFLTASWSLQRAEHGEQSYWALVAVASMLGQVGTPGGGFGFGTASIGGLATPRRRVPVPRLPTPANPAGVDIPVARPTELLERPGGTLRHDGRDVALPDVRLVWWAGGNPYHHQDLNRLEAAWQRPETIVVNESRWTATARRADLVLPATTFCERTGIGASSEDRWLVAMRRLVEP